MNQPRQPAEQVAHAVRVYHRGFICPAEMWWSIADALIPANVTAVLDALADKVKEQLVAVYDERPPVAYTQIPPSMPDEESFRAVCVQVVLWCEKNRPPPRIPSEPDGIIRVRIEDGTVKEWNPWQIASEP